MPTRKGICSLCERRRREGRPLWPAEKALICVLAIYAYGAILPDFGRLWPSPERAADERAAEPNGSWYPLGELRVEIDNDGRVTKVAPNVDTKADENGRQVPVIKVGDFIDLSTTTELERRAANQFVLVTRGKHQFTVVGNGNHANEEIAVTADPEQLSIKHGMLLPEFWGLLFAQLGACVFISLSLWLVCRRPAWQTWGLFLYSLVFNSGQYYVWYAHLPELGLRIFVNLEAFFEALGLTGLLVFAICFPESAEPARPMPVWRKRGRLLIPIAFLVLWAVRWSTFRNLTAGEPTQVLYYIWFMLTAVVFVAVGAILLHTFAIQVENRPQIRMVGLGVVTGLAAWLLADTVTTLPNHWAPANYVDFLYALSFLLPLAIYFAIRRYRVIDIRFAIRRTVVALVLAGIVVGILHTWLGHQLEDQNEDLWLPLGIVLSFAFVLMESRLHHLIQKFMFLKWHRQEHFLHDAVEKLACTDDLSVDEVNQEVLDFSIRVFELKCGAIYKRTDAGGFQLEHSFGFDVDCQKCHKALRSELMPLAGDDCNFQQIVASNEELKSKRRRAVEWMASSDIQGRTTPAYAIPILRWRHHKPMVQRILVLGPHLMDQDLDPDQIGALQELARAASGAYVAADSQEAHRKSSPSPDSLGS